MANLKNITDLPVAESAEGLNLIVNDNGAAKQIPASAVGAQADWNVSDASNPAFIKNKPVAEYDLSIKLHPIGFTDGDCNIECELLSGSYSAVVEKLNNGITPKVLVFEDASNMGELTDGEDKPWIAVCESNAALYLDVDPYVMGCGFTFRWCVLPDNSVEAAWI